MTTPSTAERSAPGLAGAIAPQQAAAEYWRTTLSDAPGLLELPTDHARPARQDRAGGRVAVELDEALSAGLEALSRRHGATLYVTLLAGWAVVLSRLSGQDDVVIGTPAAGEGEGPIGFAANTLALRVDLSGAPTVAELLERVKERALGARHHQDVPFEQVMELLQPARGPSHHPLFQVTFAWRRDGLSLPAVDVGGDVEGVGPESSQVQSKFDLSLALGESEGRIAGSVTYAAALFERETVERWVGYLRRVLEGMVADERESVERLELLPDAERRMVLEEWNATDAAYPRESCIHALFEAQVERTPASVAVEYEDQALSYAELNARANRLAYHLRTLGVGPDARVALCVERGVETVVAMLAVLKAGGAYVPLDPSYPDERLRYMLSDSRPAVLLASRAQASRFAAADVPVLDPAEDAAWAHLPAGDPRPAGLTPDHLAYVIYTSGSTGRPKGVTVPHRGVVSLLADMQRRAPIGEGDGCSLWTSTSFDVSVYEIFSALLAGGRLCIPRDDVRLEGGAFLDWMEAREVRSAYLPPYFLAELRERVSRSPGRSRLHRLLVGVEPIAEPLLAEIRRSVPGLRIVNGYGPTETTICATLHDVPDAARGERVTPIGAPAANTRVFVLDGRMGPVPVGVVGELYVGGVGVARGYLDRPALTAERFVPDPLSGEPGARLYRTGDLGRWLPEGVLAFAGRTDAQVKIRGYRVEPGEIEARLAEHPAVREAVVLAREDAPGEKRLVAYVVGDETGAELLRAHLAERLPEHMVPAAYVRLDAMPLTPSGKVDRRALPAPDADAFARRGYEAPSGHVEEAVSAIWSELLGAERVGRDDHFFELGGHSLVAVRVVSRVREALGVEALAGDLFARPVLADFARGLETAARAEAPAITPVERSERIALSFAQQRLWFLEHIGDLGSTYNIPTGLRLKGELDRDALIRALDRIVARHEALRTTFAEVDGVPEQRIAPAEASGFALAEHDLSGAADAEAALQGLLSEEARAPFDLEQGPLVRGRLIRLAVDDHVLLITMHHIVGDGWSMGVLFGELSALYAAFHDGEPDPLPPLPVHYADYAAWQRGWVEGELLERQADYWRETLAGAPELLELPADHPRPARQDFAGASLKVELDEALTAALKTLGQRHGATLHMTLLAGWAAVLARLSGQDEIVIGTPSANRGRSEIEGLIGFFVNTLALPVDLSGAPTVAELLGRVKERSLGAQHHQDIPFEQVVERVQPARSLAHTPLFQVMFAWQNAPDGTLDLPGLQSAAAPAAAQETAKFDLTLALAESGDRIVGDLNYATALFDHATVERHVGYLRRVLEEMAADDTQPVDRLELLPDAERRLVLEEWNATDGAYPREACIHTLFEAQAERTAGAEAVSFEDERLTYAELNARANRLAHHLHALGVGPDARVALCVERGVEMVVAMLAMLKAGGVYVPLDPAYPAERLRYMLEDSAPAALVTQSSLAGTFAGVGVPAVELDAPAPAWAEGPETNPARAGLSPDHLAYVIYTSGSTGRPKGVTVPHRGVVSLLADMQRRAPIVEGDGCSLWTSTSFDVSVYEIFSALLAGGRLCIPRDEARLEAGAFLDWMEAREVRSAYLPPYFLPELRERALRSPGRSHLQRLLVGVEPIAEPLLAEIRRSVPELRIVNGYGPTETTICATLHDVPDTARGERVTPIGAPAANTRVFALDARMRPVPVGAVGELYVGGVGVAPGYLDRPALTAERFVPDPLSGERGARLYRTGDLGRWLPEGALAFAGRTDAQVKIRGFRVEPGEIEARLAEHPAVREAVVLAREDAPGEKRLVAYYLADEAVAVEVLKAHLAERLPEHMVPVAYVRLDAMPLTPSGKVDRRVLPAPDADSFAARGYEAPLGEVEQIVAGIWAELLSAERVGRRDHFFERGGHSLVAVRVVSRVREALGVEAQAGDLFERPVLADFARGLETAARAEAAVIAPVDRTAPIPLSFAQQRLWFLEQMGDLGGTYHIPTGLRLKGELDRGALVRALNWIVARHEALRTTFPAVDGEPVQRIAPVEESAFRLVEHDLRASADAEDELRREVSDEASAPFDLEHGPLIRGRLVRMAADDHVLLLTMHHIVSDGWSMGVLHRELGALYAAFARGEPDPLPPLPVQYADYAAWHRRWVEGPVLEAQAQYWTETLAGAPELLELPADHPRPAKQDFAGASVEVALDEALTAALRTMSQRHGATLFMTLLAGWAAVLARLSGQDDVVVGTPSANRGHADVEELIGFFVNTLPLRVDLSGAPTVAGLLGRVRALALEAQRNQDIPFEQVVERVRPTRSLAHSPLFQAMFAWQNAPDGTPELPGLAVGPLDPAGSGGSPPHVSAKFDLSLALWEDDGRIEGALEYATALFERETVERWLGYLRRVLEEMAAADAKPIDRLELLSAAERRRVVEEWNATDAASPAGACVHERFEAQAARTPGAVAVEFEGERLTYGELNARANRLAHHLRALGVGPDARVGICVERSLEMVVGVLGVLKAGGAYVPLDPGYPAERLAYTLADSAPAAVLVQRHLRDRVERADVPVLELDAAAPAWASLPATDPGRGGLTPEHLAYVIYTSGSTGRPKGVRVPHGSLGATLAVAGDAFGLGAGDRVPSLASFAFDIWLFETLLPLLGGGAVRLVPRDRVPDVPRLLEDLARCTALHAVPALMRRIVEEVRATPEGVLGTLRHAFVGGDAVGPDLLEEMRIAFPAAEIHVLYGPTEAAIICAAHRLGSEPVARQMVGRPLGNAALYVVEPGGTVAPVGVAGELCLGGDSVARDYLGRPGLTAERFVPDPFASEPGARLYRTGDRVRWLASGELEFLGRTDHQVKVRGFRIEPGEIEARIAEHPAVRAAVVLAREDAPGEKRLVAYVAGDETATADVLRAHLSERLPEYMVPSAYVRLDALPLTPNGKVDRKALRAPEGDAFPARGYEAPAGRTEQIVAAVWAELLGAERVGRRDHFFELGGHSLLAVRVVSRVRQALGVETSPRDVFERPVLADFARGLETAARAEAPAITPVDRTAPIPLSFAQQRLWFLEQMGDLGGTYHIPTGLRLKGELDRGALARSLDRIVARHEALRTTFAEMDGVPEQRIAPAEASGFALAEHDLGGAADAEAEHDRWMDAEARTPFDLERGPLVRGRLIRLAADDHVLLLTMHHIVSDGWSMGVLFRELSALYAAFRDGEPDPLPPLPVQYPDYAAWQRRWVEGELLERQAGWWERALAGAPELLELPTDRARPRKQDFAGDVVDVELDEALTAALKALSQRHGATLFMTLLAGWAAVLARLSGQDDVVVGTPSANRGRKEIEELIGFFVNTLALRVDLAASPSVSELLGQVKRQSLEAQQNQDIPFEQVVERVQPARSLAHTPLFQVMFAWQNAPGESLDLPGLGVRGVGPASRPTAKFDLSLSLGEAGGRIVGSVTYATALFERATVERWLGYLRRVLGAMVADDAQGVDRLELLDEAERSLVLEAWNRTEAKVPRDTCVHALFEAQVARTPDAVAVDFEDRALTYAALNARANRLAHHLRGRGVGPDVRVAVCIERSPELMVAFLAVLKAGGAYVPLDPGDPEDRLRHMLDDAAPAALLVHAGTAARFAGEARPLIDLDAGARDWADEPAANPSAAGGGPALGHLAYVIYTSGSTGRPKGVMVEHRALANVMGWMGEAWPLGAHDVVLQKTPVSFDASARELFPPLLAGARMVIARPGGHRDPAYLAETIRRQGVTTLHFVPTMLQLLLEEPGIERCASIARVVCGGEALPAALARRAAELLPNAELHNVYGPTEAAVDVTWMRCPAEVAGPHVSIGRAMAGCRAYFLDAAGRPVPAGVAGELYLGGAQVARGYLGRPALTAERFVPDPFGGEPGARLYRTGDLGRRLPDGTIEFLGRNDFQVKVRGFRIELGEIEARLREHPGVREAVAAARENEAGDRRLVAYWVGDAVEIDALRAHLSGRLPEHMVPAAFVRLEALPLTSNGKLNRRALPTPEADAYARRGYEAPRGKAERALAEIWGELLGVERVGRRDHFFELGGHSLLAVRLISRVRQVLGAEVALGDLFERPVLADLARALETGTGTGLPPVERVDPGARRPLSFAQQRLWFLEQMGDLGSTYHIGRWLRLGGELDRAALRRALDAIVARHEVLRTTFVEMEGEPAQRIVPVEESRFQLAEHDLGGDPDARSGLRRLLGEEARAPFDLAHGPLVRGRLIRLAEDEHVLLVTMHHIVSDGWSMGVLTRELGALYGAFRRGEPDPLAPLPVQYADYAAWQRRWVEGDVLQYQAEYWTSALAGAPELLELPTDHPRPPRQDHAGAAVAIGLDEALTAGLKALGQRHGTTLFMTLLAGWAVVLARLSGQDDVVIGTPSANRGRSEIEGLIGFFINTLPLRVDLSDGPTVGELLRRVKTRALEAQRNQDIPLEQVVERVRPARSLAYTPLFQVTFAWQNAGDGAPELPGLAVGLLDPADASSEGSAKFDLSLVLWEDGERIEGGVEYATALFERETVERWLGYLRRVLEGMVADDAVRVDGIPLLPAAERARLVEEWNAGDAAPLTDQCIHHLFEAQVARTPEATALVHEGERLTYAELDARANRLAHRLAAVGVERGTAVGVCLEWRPELVVALLATLKAGGVYVPLDPSLPAGRLAYIADDAEVRAVVTRAGLADRVPSGAAVRVDVDADEVSAAPGEAPRASVSPEDLAYVIYTSGSTGQPKGVAVEHGAAAAHLVAVARVHGVVPEDRVLQFASAGFDVSLEQVFFPLLTGATLVLRGAELWSATELRERVRALGITVANLPPAYWQEVADGAAGDALAGIRLLLIGGDALPVTAGDARGAGTLVNCYGPTETVITATAFAVGQGAAGGPLVPIGRPLPGRAVYVLDPRGAPVPVGVAGELYIGGPLLARGYLGRPALTAERFVPDPFGRVPGGRLYRTGDRVRWSASGNLEFLGRTDFQVKIRGFRIELGEIEAGLRGHPAVRDAVVLARADAPGDTRLVAYVVGDADAEALRASLAERLPEYMLPAAYVRLDALPLTPNGKLDRGALPAPDGDAFARRGFEPPRGEAERALAEIWGELLGMERVGRRDHFFESGGHSLLAVRVASRVRRRLGVEASPRDVFERPVLEDFARGLETAARVEAAAIERVDRTGVVPPSFAQQRLWFLEQLGGMGATYHIPTSLRLRGDLDRGALVRALDRIVARHEALRTNFAAVDGEPVQRIAPVEESAFRLVEHDLRASANAEDELRRLVSAEAGAAFDLEHGPLIRGRLVRLAADDHVLLLTMHHIVSDGWSAGVLHRELGALYAAFARGEPDPLPPLPVQYADYAAWHRRWVDGPVLEAQAEYWTETLGGAPELLELPTDHPRPAKQDFAGASMGVELDEALTAALKTLSQRHGTTVFMTLLAGWAAVLARLSGQDDVVIGTPSANRGHAEVEELIGFFVNILPVRVNLSDGPRVGELLQRVKTRALEAQRNQDIPFEQVVELVRPARSLAYSPLFQVMFAWQNAPDGTPELPGLAVGPLDPSGSGDPSSSQGSAKFDLSLALWENGERIEGGVEYATALFERETVERWLGYLRRVLEGMVADDHQRVDRLAVMPESERVRVVGEWSHAEAADPSGQCIHELFEAQVARTPDATALVHEGERLTYAELDARANRLAYRLAAVGVERGVAVGVCLEWRPELVVALLATLKAGGVYVPLDPSLPAGRLAYIAEDAGVRAVVTRAGLADRVPAGAAVRVDVDADEVSAAPAEAPRTLVSPDDLAYVIYTSGSTGRPKGVAVEHGAAAAHLVAVARVHGIVPEDRVLQFASAGFDVSLEQVFFPLLTGATLVLRGAELWSATEFRARVRALGITVANLPPAYWQEVADGAAADALAGIRLLLIGGDALPASAGGARGAGRLVNCYGPTETVVTATAFAVGQGTAAGPLVPIGRPLPGRAVYVLDPRGAPVPVGVAGELYIGGPLLARGYLGRPALTAERFVPDPFGRVPGGRLYRTGDRVRWNASGNLEFLGRTDFQVKIRGFRIELGEIEAGLRGHPAVRAAVVLARADAPGDTRLVAYVVGDADAEALRSCLAERLPEYMLPAAYVQLDALPLTPNGKLDRGALPAPEGDAFARRGYEAPSGRVEAAVSAIWAELLGAERVGRGDHFFELGGHSLLAVRVVSRVRQALGVEAAISDLFVRPVLADFARGLETAADADLPAIVPADRGGRLELSFAQQRLWVLEQMEGAGTAYHLPMRLRLRGELDREALTGALDRIVARHEALRTSFPETEGIPAQRISAVEESPFHLAEHDLEGRPEAPRELGRLVAEEAEAPFDLARGPLVRGRLIRLAGDDHVLLVTMHHIVSDGWSMGIFTRELSALYEAFRGGRPDPLPPLPVQYADYAAWQRRWVEGEVLQRQADYWRETLAGAPELLELPTDRARPRKQDFAGDSVNVELDETLTAALKTLGQRHGATLHMTLLAGWAAVLARLSGQDEVVVGTPSANRGRSEIEGLIGFFVNTLALRVDLSGSPGVAELLTRVKERSLGAQHHQDIPFEQVVDLLQPVRSLAHTPLFQVMFAWQNAPGGSLELPGLALSPLDPSDTRDSSSQVSAKFDLSLALWEDGGRIAGALNYATALFDRETVERWLGYLRRALEEMAADDAQPVDRLDLLSAEERRRVLEEWNATDAAYPREACIHALFEAQVERTPAAVAVEYEDRALTYAELNARANRLAHHLHSLGVGPDARVALCVERGVEMVVAMLAVLKAGGAYLPLDPSYPDERLRYMLSDSRPAVLLASPAQASRFAAAGVPVLDPADEAAWAHLPATNPRPAGLTPDHLAYVIYTSGSTGRPKGVTVPHRGVVSLLADMQRRAPIGEGDGCSLWTSTSFDVSVYEIFSALLAGGRLCIPRDDVRLEAGAFLDWMEARDVRSAYLPPYFLAELRERALRSPGRSHLQRLLVGVEPIAEPLLAEIRRSVPGLRIVNGYGPTETTICATLHDVPDAARGERVTPIGAPAANTRVFVLDARMRPVPLGAVGELYVGGVGVARGYLDRPALTAERFVPDPLSGEPGARLYRTGDVGRWLAEGALAFAGRTDAQVKIRGFRVEPGEIEARLAEHPAVRETVVLAREDAPGDKRLVAYVVGDEAVAVEVLKAHLAERLPEHMVPAAYVRLDAMPLTPSGKVDRRALPTPGSDAFAARDYEAPAGETEEAVAGIWAELLGLERVGRHDDFFQLGGNSLLAIRLVFRIRREMDVELSVADVFEKPELSLLAQHLRDAQLAQLDPELIQELLALARAADVG